MIIHHYVPHTANVGDLFVRDGIHLRLKEIFPQARIVELPANDPDKVLHTCVGMTGENLERTNAEAQLVVVGGSNLYQGPDWRFKTDENSIKALRVPLCFIGLGTGSIRSGHGKPLDERSRREIILSHEKALGVAVRDYATAQLLRTLGIDSTVTACPAAFVGRETFRVARPKKILVSAPPRRFVPRLWRKSMFQNGWMYLGFQRLLRMLEKSGIDWQVIVHDSRDNDYVAPLLAPYGRQAVSPGMNTAAYYEAFRSADLVIAYRLHMGISALGWGVPLFLVDFDLRTRAFIETFECDAIAFDAFSPPKVAGLLRAVKRFIAYPEQYQQIYQRMLERREFFWNKTSGFYSEIREGIRY
jgi:polysaccharide pyruvyl transferase WcaK-like protein